MISLPYPADREEWRAIPGIEGYEVSSQGRVRSWQSGGNRPKRVDAPKVLRHRIEKGYPRLTLKRDGANVHVRIHRAIALAFLGDPPGSQSEVCHIDGCKANNSVNNLYWGTHTDNMHDMARHGLKREGETQGQAKLTNKDVIEMRQRYAAGERPTHLAREFGVDPSNARKIVKGIAWKCVAVASLCFAFVANAERPAQAPPVRKCFCEACQCGPSCTCSSGECRCPTCKDRLQVQPFGTAEELPLQIIAFTASWCEPCSRQHPAWSRVAAENPGLMSELDLDENGPLARQWGVTAIPCVVVVRDGKLLTRYRAGVLSEGQLRSIVGQWRGR